MNLLKEQIELAKDDGARTVGFILLEISKISRDALKLIEQDLAMPGICKKKQAGQFFFVCSF